jgi:hypothetical protein
VYFITVIVFPVLLLLLLLAMERVERLLVRDQVSVELGRLLESPSLDLAPESGEPQRSEPRKTAQRRRLRFARARRWRERVR